MSAAPGWQPDPTGRHEHRFWDGTRWTDDVADRGVASVDPLAGPARPATPTPPTPQPQPQPQPIPQPQPQPQPAPQHFAAQPTGGDGDGGGRSTALLVALGVVVLALVAGILVVLTGQDDGDDEATDTTTTSTTEATTTTTTTDPDDSSDQVVEEFATAIHEGSDGNFSLDQARCMARGILDVIGLERLAEVRIEAGDDVTVNPVDLLTDEEQEAAFDVMRECVPEGSIDQPSSG